MTGNPDRPSWASSVEWAKADVLKPESYKSFLNGANAVVHTMGILLEADYKGVVQGREPIISGLQRAFSSSKLGSQNPLQRREGEKLEPKERDGQLTYELMNRDSGSCISRSIVLPPHADEWLDHSNRISAGILQRARSNFCIHFCCWRSTDSPEQIHNN